MKTKVKQYFITYLSLVLVLSNFSFATTMVLCEMDGGNHQCVCTNSNDTGNNGLAVRSVAKSCCEARIVELSNSNVLEILHNNIVNPFAHVELINSGVDNLCSFSMQAFILNYNFSYHPPNSEIPILNSSLLI
jgi:hypothetical protein